MASFVVAIELWAGVNAARLSQATADYSNMRLSASQEKWALFLCTADVAPLRQIPSDLYPSFGG